MKISILISIYNEPIEWIKESFNSILNQSFNEYEVVLINDNPDREENDILIKEYSNRFNSFIYIKNEINIGLTKSLNRGLKLCTGEFIARMDADDIMSKDRLSLQCNFMQKNRDYVICGTQRIDFNDKLIRKTFNPIDDFEIRTTLIFNSPFTHPSVLIRKSIFDKYNLSYNEECPFAQDYELWTRLLNYGKGYNLNKYLINYRINENGQTARNSKNKLIKEKLIKEIQKKYIINQGIDLSVKEFELLYILSLNDNICNLNKMEFSVLEINLFFKKLMKFNFSKNILGRFYFKLIYYKKISFLNYFNKKLFYYGVVQYFNEYYFKANNKML